MRRGTIANRSEQNLILVCFHVALRMVVIGSLKSAKKERLSVENFSVTASMFGLPYLGKAPIFRVSFRVSIKCQ